VVVASLALWFFAAVALDIWDEFRLSATMPTAPDPTAGFIYPATVNHGYHVYLDRHEVARSRFVYWFFATSFAPLGIALFINQKYDVFPPYSKRTRS
jgi:hypothetical protein